MQSAFLNHRALPVKRVVGIRKQVPPTASLHPLHPSEVGQLAALPERAAVAASSTATTTSAPPSSKKMVGKFTDVIHYTSGQEYGPDNVIPFDTEYYSRFPRVEATSTSLPIVICPGFGNQTSDYEVPLVGASGSFTSSLKDRGFSPYVVPLIRKDWFKIARGLLTIKFWQTKLGCDPGYRWYLDRLDATVKEACEKSGSDRVILVGHSAGGWLARAYLADAKYGAPAGGPNARVAGLVTLGTPQAPPPKGTVRDVTGGALTTTNESYPGAFFEGIQYLCVSGRVVRGKNNRAQKEQKLPRSLATYAAGSYEQVCGSAEDFIEGDCVVPNDYAFLERAENVLLDGTFHSMSRVGSYDDYTENQWYGSERVVDSWLAHMQKWDV